ncbi:hypothetical protein BGZ81_000122, partial [Podila clonocystis]
TTIHPYQFKANSEGFIVEFTLSSMDVTVPPVDRADPAPALGEIILEKLYNDEAHEDVFFVFDSISDATASTGQLDINPGTTSNTSTDANVSVEHQQDPGMDSKNSDEGKGRLKSDCIHSRGSGQITIGAHKLVLCQWPYFKSMFESGFKEGGAGNKEVRVRDTSPKAFHLLLRFIYTGNLPRNATPTTVFMDPLNDLDASWESLYLLAHRCDIQELIDIARARILSKLNPEESVEFLFRTAYLFTDLREPVIKYAVESCGSILSSKSVRETYSDHPEGVQIFGEVLEQLYVIKK